MPSRAFHVGLKKEIKFYEYDDLQWQDLKSELKKDPKMLRCVDPNCNGLMVLCTRKDPNSYRRPRWFAHRSGEKKDIVHKEGGGKSELHETIQDLIYKILKDSGLEKVELEETLVMKSGNRVRTDIFIENEKSEKLSIEVQLSDQAPFEYRDRTKKYLSSEIDRILWIGWDYNETIVKMAPYVNLVEEDANLLTKDDLNSIFFTEPDFYVNISFPGSIETFNGEPIPLADFLLDFISGKFVWQTCKLTEQKHWHNDYRCSENLKWEQRTIQLRKEKEERDRKREEEELKLEAKRKKEQERLELKRRKEEEEEQKKLEAEKKAEEKN